MRAISIEMIVVGALAVAAAGLAWLGGVAAPAEAGQLAAAGLWVMFMCGRPRRRG